MDGAHTSEVEFSHYQVSCSTSADGPSATQSPGDQIQSPIPPGELPQEASFDGTRNATELSRTISPDSAPAPFWEING